MTQISVRLEGTDKVRAGLNKFIKVAEGLTKAKLKAAMRDAKRLAIPYNGGNSYDVPERSYIRTGNLGRSAILIESGLTYRIEVKAYNDAGKLYGEYVIGKADGSGQARVHWGYWQTLRNSVDLMIDTLKEELDQEYQNGVEAAGL